MKVQAKLQVTVAKELRRRVAQSGLPEIDPPLVRLLAGGHDEMARQAVLKKAQPIIQLYCRLGARQVVRSAGAQAVVEPKLAGAERKVRRAVADALLSEAAKGPHGTEAKLLLWNVVKARVSCLANSFEPLARSRKGMTAADLAQEAAIKLWKAVEQFDWKQGFWQSFIELVMRRLFIQLTRGRDPGEQLAAAQLARGRLGTPPQPAETLLHKELAAIVDEVCWQMLADGYPRDEVRAFRLRRLGGKSLADIGWLLDRSITWTHNAIGRTEGAFAEKLGRMYPQFAG